MIGDASATNKDVFLVGMTGQVATLLDRLGVLKSVKKEQQVNSRLEALQDAAKLIA